MNKRIKFFILVCIIISIITMILFTGLSTVGKKYLVGSKYDSRANRSIEIVKRGSIFDRNNILINHSELIDGKYLRQYNFPELYSHLIGYVDKKYGSTGIENAYNSILQGYGQISSWTEIKNKIYKEKCGENLILSVDHKLQSECKSLMRNLKGAIVITDPRNGEVLSYYSNPGFDETKINEALGSNDSAMLDRVKNGKYSPGSVFKIISSLNILNNTNDLEFDDQGFVKILDGTISNYGKIKYGRVDLHAAITNSLNTFFAVKGLPLTDKLVQLTNDIDNKIKESTDNNYAINIRKGDNNFKNAILQIGQGEVTASPLAINLITQAIYNEGYYYSPKYVKSILTNDFKFSRDIKSEKIDLNINKEHAKYIKDAMFDVVKIGTASGYGLGDDCGGKTGTAELSGKKYNYWFTGFISGEKPKIITIVVENVNEMGYNKTVEIFRNLVKQNL